MWSNFLTPGVWPMVVIAAAAAAAAVSSIRKYSYQSFHPIPSDLILSEWVQCEATQFTKAETNHNEVGCSVLSDWLHPWQTGSVHRSDKMRCLVGNNKYKLLRTSLRFQHRHATWRLQETEDAADFLKQISAAMHGYSNRRMQSAFANLTEWLISLKFIITRAVIRRKYFQWLIVGL